MKHRYLCYGTMLCVVAGINFSALAQVVTPPPAPVPGSNSSVQAPARQQKTISGRVLDTDGKGLPGASVRVLPQNTGVATDAFGNFTIQAAPGSTVSVSFVGYTTQNFTVNAQNRYTIRMAPAAANQLRDVVLIGYGAQRAKDVTSAVTRVTERDFNKGGTQNPLELIQGKVAGLSITRPTGNNPNGGTSIQLRGLASLTGSQSPLIVIDGVPGGNLDLLQQDDIASFDILKDASAAAIYGTRANAGVILITTKKGRGGKTVFSYSGYAQHEVADRIPDYLSAAEYRTMKSAVDRGADIDLFDMLLNKKNLSQYHNLAVTGGTDESNYRVSLYYNEAQGLAKESGRQQYGGKANFNLKGLGNHLTLASNLAYNLNEANLLGGSGAESNDNDFASAIIRNPTLPIYNEDGTWFRSRAYGENNPIARLATDLNRRDQSTILGDVRLTGKIIDGLEVSVFGAMQRNSWNDRAYRQRASTWLEPIDEKGEASKSNFLDKNYLFEGTATYNTTLGKSRLTALLGYSYQYFTTETYSMLNKGFLTDAFEDWNMGAGSLLAKGNANMGSNKYDSKLIAGFGRINYTYDDKYILQAILRREGSSKFGANNKWGYFPALSVGWNLSNEDFMKDNKTFSNLKLRAGYGVTGNSGISSYHSLITLGTGGKYLQYIDNSPYWVQTYGPGRNPNPDLRWERKAEYNFGLDFGVLNNRLSGSIDYYVRNTSDLLLDYGAQIPAFISSSLYTNVGTVTNKGLEIALNSRNITNTDFSWNTTANFSYNTNKLSKLSNETYKRDYLTYQSLPNPGNLGPAMRVYEGGQIGTFYGKKFAGFTDDGKFLFYKKDGTKVRASEINSDDYQILGYGVPKYYAALSNNFRYKNFDLTIFLRGKFGYKVLNLLNVYSGIQTSSADNVLKEAITTNAHITEGTVTYSDYFLENGSFVKLDNVTLGYNVPIKKSLITSLRVYGTARDLFTITGYKGIDPEVQDVGTNVGIATRGFYPHSKSFTLGLTATF